MTRAKSITETFIGLHPYRVTFNETKDPDCNTEPAIRVYKCSPSTAKIQLRNTTPLDNIYATKARKPRKMYATATMNIADIDDVIRALQDARQAIVDGQRGKMSRLERRA